MSTKRIANKDLITKIIATRLGLPVSSVTTVIEMQEKVIKEHLKNNYSVMMDSFYVIRLKRRKAYTFRSGLNHKKYYVAEKIELKITPAKTLVSHINTNSDQ